MGLSGRKSKQRISHDPRNLSWADDAARFGSNYLAKFGWESSKGLGVSGEGRTTHIKVAQKLDMMGIGAAHQKDPNGVAWKQNKDYENLLKRLNEANGGEEEVQTGSGFDGFVRPEGNAGEEGEEDEKKKEKRKKEKVKKKRKRDEDAEDTGRKLKKKKSVEKHACNADVESTAPVPSRVSSPGSLHSAEQKTPRVVPRHRSHRARHIAAKSIGLKSAAAISEILGIAPSPSCATPSGAETPQGKLTSVYDDNDDALDDALDTDKIITSTKTLQDYFKGKMDSVAVTSLRTGTGDSPRAGLGSRPDFSGHNSSTFMIASSLTLMPGMEEEKRRRKKVTKVP